MTKSKQSRETAKALVSPLFAITNAFLKGGEMVLDSMQAASKNATGVRVAVLEDADAPLKRSVRGKSKARSTPKARGNRVKGRSRRRS